MFEWLSINIGSIVAGLIVLAIIGLAILSLVRDKKNGKPSCGSSCSGCGACAMKGNCQGNCCNTQDNK